MGRLASITAHFACVSSFDVGESISHATPGALFSSGDWKIIKKETHIRPGYAGELKGPRRRRKKLKRRSRFVLFCFVFFFLLLYNVYKWKGRCARKCVSTRTFPTKIKRIQKHKNKPKRIGIHFSITNIDWQRLDNLLHLPVLFYLFLFFRFSLSLPCQT
jgi:hypothetical protein